MSDEINRTSWAERARILRGDRKPSRGRGYGYSMGRDDDGISIVTAFQREAYSLHDIIQLELVCAQMTPATHPGLFNKLSGFHDAALNIDRTDGHTIVNTTRAVREAYAELIKEARPFLRADLPVRDKLTYPLT